MSVFSSGHPARRQAAASIRARCHAMLAAMVHRLSQVYDDNRLFTVVVIVVGFLPCVLLMFGMFAK
jgi:hypothetical protein